MTRISLAFIFVESMIGLALGQQVVVTPEETGQTAATEVTLENASAQVQNS